MSFSKSSEVDQHVKVPWRFLVYIIIYIYIRFGWGKLHCLNSLAFTKQVILQGQALAPSWMVAFKAQTILGTTARCSKACQVCNNTAVGAEDEWCVHS